MRIENIRDQLRAFAGTTRKVRIERRQPKEPRANGFVLDVGEELVLLQVFHDFYPEGIAVLRLCDVLEVRYGPYEHHWERMLRAEGIAPTALVGAPPPLDDMHDLLESLRERGANVIVECEDDEEPISDFYIGRVLKVDAGTIEFANFDALGKWDDEPHRIELAEITNVGIQTPYLEIFSRHLESSCPFEN
jgi:hypothetical protein